MFGVDGSVKQVVKPLDRPNNVDIEYGLATPSGPVDIAVVTERLQHRLRVYRDQIPGGSVLRVYRREGQPGQPHVHDPAVATLVTTADTTDGIDATVSSLGDRFPEGLLVMMNNVGRNYQFYDLRGMLDKLKDR